MDNALLKMHGIVSEDAQDNQMSPKQCTRCGTMNAHTSQFCTKYRLALDIKAALARTIDVIRNVVHFLLFSRIQA